MGTETKVVDAVISESGFTPSAVIADVNVDDTTWTIATANNVNNDLRLSLPTPTGPPTTGVGVQTFSAIVRKNGYGGGGSGTPTVRFELWETGGSTLIAASSEIDVTSTTGQTVTWDWDAVDLATADGSAVEVRLCGTAVGGAPGGRAAVDYDYVEWQVDFSEASTFDVTGQATIDFLSAGLYDVTGQATVDHIAASLFDVTGQATVTGIAANTTFTSVSPTEFDDADTGIDIVGTNFLATQDMHL